MPKKAARTQRDSPDVQAQDAPRPYALTRVGVKGVKKPVTVHRPGQDPHGVVGTFDLYVDLPKTQKGTHMSRNLEALADILDEEVAAEAPSLENLCRRLAVRLLEKHDYASHAHVRAETDYFLKRRNPGGRSSIEPYRLLAEAEAFREGNPKGKRATLRRVGVQVVGMSACPCAMETVRHKFTASGHRLPAELPVITHNQRNKVTLMLDLPGDADVEAGQLVDICEASLSAPTFEILKRGDEGDLVIQAHGEPRFVEDVVREALHRVDAKYGKLRGAEVFVSSEAEESIHKHNAYAERRTTVGGGA
ncbi:MAG TPA: GTP cyclohydrolase MptA [Candidatus Thermoplasmatota archaeon]|nr:GTP cyclohydrolase MptA [Candidatus Thermoplasmatota archaeon]